MAAYAVLDAIRPDDRNAILNKLKGKKECSVGELRILLRIEYSTVSQHLAVLREIGVVKFERRGTKSFYSLVVDRYVKIEAAIDMLNA